MAITIFDRLDKCVPEQENILCPFCNAGYTHAFEYRQCVKCPICQGNGYKAEQADQEVDNVLTMVDTLTTDEIRSYLLKLGSGFYRSELRVYLNKRISEENEDE